MLVDERATERDSSISASLNTVVDAVHDAFKAFSGEEKTLANELGSLCNKYGDAPVKHAMIECARVAYLRLSFTNQR